MARPTRLELEGSLADRRERLHAATDPQARELAAREFVEAESRLTFHDADENPTRRSTPRLTGTCAVIFKGQAYRNLWSEVGEMAIGDMDAESLDGCSVEPDGRCPHGFPSWPRAAGLL